MPDSPITPVTPSPRLDGPTGAATGDGGDKGPRADGLRERLAAVDAEIADAEQALAAVLREDAALLKARQTLQVREAGLATAHAMWRDRLRVLALADAAVALAAIGLVLATGYAGGWVLRPVAGAVLVGLLASGAVVLIRAYAARVRDRYLAQRAEWVEAARRAAADLERGGSGAQAAAWQGRLAELVRRRDEVEARLREPGPVPDRPADDP